VNGKVSLVSVGEAQPHDTDLPIIVAALAERGVQADINHWDNAAVDWSQYEAAIVRSPWDYHRRYTEFVEWLQHVSMLTRLHNSADLITWNTNKVYLGELAEVGLPIIPTTYIAGAEQLVLFTTDGGLNGDVVVKPTVSAGSNNTERHVGDPVVAAAHIASLLDAGMVAMVQPYQGSIDAQGETGLLYFNGQYSHAFRKGAILATGENVKNGLFVVEDIGGRDAAPDELAVAESVLSYVRERWGSAPLYARVDLVRNAQNEPVLMELELAEPSLFLHTAEGAAERFAEAVLAVL